MIRVGDRDVIFAQAILIPRGEEASITTSNGESTIALRLVIEDVLAPDGKPDPSMVRAVKIEGKSDHALVTLINWDTLFGAATMPMEIGKTATGQTVWLILDCVRAKGVARVFVQIMLGDVKR